MAIVGHFEFDCVEIFHGFPYIPETVHFAFLVLDGLAIWHGLPDIMLIKVNNGQWSAS